MNQLDKAKIENRIATKIIEAAFEVYDQLGPGLMESAYSYCLMLEFKEKGLAFKSELALPIEYKSHKLNHHYRLDFLVEDKVVIELKATESIHEVHYAQLLTYLKLSRRKLGLLINFHSSFFKSGIKRVVNGL
ncbi:MAG: GxxExxY protein [Bacteroidetes bacterium]|nr:GxxExxY protein [Bacteroidota bacterium]